jgi:tetratricopeptide (TPR) repeat protein
LRRFCGLLAVWLCLGPVWAGETPGTPPGRQPDPMIVAMRVFHKTRQHYRKEPQNSEAQWQFARACFEWGEFATNREQRADIAQQGVDACQQLLARESNSAPGHYYLAMNLGQLARTRTLGALKLVNEMEVEFTRAIELEKDLDYAGPDRNLGVLYCEAPVIASIGSRVKARQHLERAVELAPQFPANRLSLIDAHMKWKEWDEAARQFRLLERQWEEARKRFAGEPWIASWADWNPRMADIRQKLEKRGALRDPASR